MNKKSNENSVPESEGQQYREIVNLTIHNDFKEFTSGLTIPMSNLGIARVETKKVPIYRDPRGFTIYKKEYGNIVGLDLDNIDPNKIYLVSAVVLNALHDRGIKLDNIVAPDTSIRDGSNNVIGSRDFRING